MTLPTLRLSLISNLAFVLTSVFVLTACQPVTAALPTPTPTPVVLTNGPTPPPLSVTFPQDAAILPPVATQPPTAVPPPTLPAATPTPEVVDGPITVAIDAVVPEDWTAAVLPILNGVGEVLTAGGAQPLRVLDEPANAGARVTLLPGTEATQPLATRVLAVVAPYATLRDDITLADLRQRWADPTAGGPVYVTPEAAAWLAAVLGTPPTADAVVPREALLTQLENNPGSLGVTLFEQVDPRLKVLTVDGANVLSNQFRADAYPLAVTLTVEGRGASAIRPLLAEAVQPATNRNAERLSQLVMTGVTAMSRVTALRQDQKGYDYPARVISDVFAAADITHISNEVPFLDDCVANPTENNLILCSDTDYWAALAALGTDIVGLSGNHVNDFGRDGARRSLQWYRDNAIPIYGSGLNVQEACAPLLWEHNGNTFAFIAALAFDPPGAWATEEQPGACYFYTNKELILAMVTALASQVDIVAVELQHQETYEPYPIPLQVAEFRELRAAGADIVTGVMSHVPQAQEPYGQADAGGPGIISYGLGNFFFDQMWSWQTRTELATRHTIYDGRLLATELLTMVLEDFAQPRWATPEERTDILTRIFSAAPARQ